jgi:GH25 family lysozyme M1 (1,4-beta-N-acetylmuramidase)
MEKYVLGIDISFCQGSNVDFDSVKSAGIKYVICKATHGGNPTSIDPTFKSNWAKLKGKIARGAYMWYVPGTDPIKQADHFVDTMLANGFDENDLPPAIDFEQNTTVAAQPLLDGVVACVKRIRERTNRKVIFYTGKWYWSGFVKDLDCPELLDMVDLWHAEYPSSRRVGTEYAAALAVLPSPHPPTPWAKRNIAPLIWQFDGDKGLVLPQGTDSDFDRFNGSEEEFYQWIKDSNLVKLPESVPPTPEVVMTPPEVAVPVVASEPEPPPPEDDSKPVQAPPINPSQESGLVSQEDSQTIFTTLIKLLMFIINLITGSKK